MLSVVPTRYSFFAARFVPFAVFFAARFAPFAVFFAARFVPFAVFFAARFVPFADFFVAPAAAVPPPADFLPFFDAAVRVG